MIKGTAQAQRQADEMEYISGSGWSTVHIWHGTKAAIDGLLTSDFTIQYQRISVRSIDSNVVFECRASFAGEGQPTTDDILADDWELSASGDQPDIRHHSRFVALSSAEKALLESYIKDPSLLISDNPSLSGDADLFFQEIRNGVVSFIRSYVILRNTKTVLSAFTINVGMSNVELRHSFAQLPTITNAGVALAVANLNAAGAPFTVPANYEWSWLKQRPTVTGAALGRAQIVQEFWLYAWSQTLYPHA